MCKACKAECPLGVDMAKLKSETLSHYHDEHGVPLRTRVFGAIRTLNRLGSATAPLSNVPGRVPLLRTRRPSAPSASPRGAGCRTSSGRTWSAGSGAQDATRTPAGAAPDRRRRAR